MSWTLFATEPPAAPARSNHSSTALMTFDSVTLGTARGIQYVRKRDFRAVVDSASVCQLFQAPFKAGVTGEGMMYLPCMFETPLKFTVCVATMLLGMLNAHLNPSSDLACSSPSASKTCTISRSSRVGMPIAAACCCRTTYKSRETCGGGGGERAFMDEMPRATRERCRRGMMMGPAKMDCV